MKDLNDKQTLDIFDLRTHWVIKRRKHPVGDFENLYEVTAHKYSSRADAVRDLGDFYHILHPVVDNL